MQAPDPAAVAAATAAWAWYPPDADVVETERFLLVRYPDHFLYPTQVLRVQPGDRLDDLVDEVLDQVRAWGRRNVLWWLPSRDPLEGPLARRGATVVETLSVLARGLTDGGPALEAPATVEVRAIATEEDLRAAERLDIAVFGGAPAPDDAATVAAELARLSAEETAGSGIEVIAVVDGEAVGIAGAALVDGVLRLWGGGVAEHARHRGVYRALLHARIAWGVRHGAKLALVKGRVTTSGPVLRRAGFLPYGEQRSWLLPS
jgi:GNAT superfamily N-acetyltransferase